MRNIRPLILSLLSILFAAGPAGASSAILFSPNGDGILDSAIFGLKISDSQNIGEWNFVIRDNSGREIKQFSGKGAPPPTLAWNGKDQNNQLIADGSYHYTLTIVTLAGNRVNMDPQQLVCDRQAPTARVSVEPSIFSPEEGSAKPTAQFFMDTLDANGIHSWLLRIQSGEGTAKSFYGQKEPPASVVWDGRNDAGEPATDGTYNFTLAARDHAGHTTTTAPQTVRIDRATPGVSVEAVPNIFSPNGDGNRDVVKFDIESPPSQKVIENWALKIRDAKGRDVQVFDGLGAPPRDISWDGKQSSGRLSADGPYTYVFTSRDQAGNLGATVPKSLIVDITPPQATVALGPQLLSPNGDGIGDSGTFQIRVEEANGIRAFGLEIRNDVGDLKRMFSGKETPPEKLQWEGQDDAGKTLVDGEYSHTLRIEDFAGNAVVTAASPFQVDTTAPVVDLVASPKLISPNGDQKEAAIQIALQDASALESWSLEIRDAQGAVVRKFGGSDRPASVAWDGQSDGGKLVADGTYTLNFQARDVAHNGVTFPTQSLTVGAQIPRITARAGMPIISPNADGVKDATAFALTFESFNPVQQWKLGIADASGIVVREFTGIGSPPAELAWGGERDDKSPAPHGHYSFVFHVRDLAGNQSETARQPVQIDTIRPLVAAQAVPALFSPNKDGIADLSTFQLSYEDESPVGRWTLALKNAANKAVKTFSGAGRVPASVEWDGLSDDGKPAGDGLYTYIFSAEDVVGNAMQTLEQIVKLDVSPPQTTIAADPTLFSPSSESGTNHTVFRITAQDASDLSHWRLEIVNTAGGGKHEFSGEGRPPLEIRWEGRDDRNGVLPDGDYQARLTVKDQVGNEARGSETRVRLDTSKPVMEVAAHESMVPSLVPEIPFAETSRGIVISLAAEVLFETGRAEIRPNALSTLDEAAAIIKRYPERLVIVEGHTDNQPINTPEFPSNQKLSEARAAAVRDHFANARRIDAARLSVRGYGDTRAIGDNATPAGRQKNRRVEIVIEKPATQAHK